MGFGFVAAAHVLQFGEEFEKVLLFGFAFRTLAILPVAIQLCLFFNCLFIIISLVVLAAIAGRLSFLTPVLSTLGAGRVQEVGV